MEPSASITEVGRTVPGAYVDNADVAAAPSAVAATHPRTQLGYRSAGPQARQCGIDIYWLHAPAGGTKGVDTKALPKVVQALQHSG